MKTAIGYKMTHDTGFAPNPFHGYLTLATCKPRIRRARKVGDWVAGFASRELAESSRKHGADIPYQGLVYLMQIEEKIPLDSYFEAPRFNAKRPTYGYGTQQERCGDNVYYRNGDEMYFQLLNESHGEDQLAHDTGGVYALTATRFYYFGRNCFVPEGGWTKLLGMELSSGRTFMCAPGFVEKLLSYFEQRGITTGIHGLPCGWNISQELKTGVSSGCGHNRLKQINSAPIRQRTAQCSR